MNILLGYGYYPATTATYFEKALAQRHNITYVGTPWDALSRPGYTPDMDLAQYVSALPIKPDLFLYIDSELAPYAPRGLEKLPCPTAAYLVDAWPPGIRLVNQFRPLLAPLFDYLFVAHKGAAELFSSYRDHLPVHWVPLGCDPDIHKEQPCERIYDVGFVGQINPTTYPERVQMLAVLQAHYKMNDFRQPHYLEDMARIYSQSKIVFNISHTNRILSMRFFEVPPSGALLLSEYSDSNGQSELLQEGEHYISYRGLDDLLAKVDYYLAHDEERERIARAGQAYVLANHTYAIRAQTMLDIIQNDGRRRCAPVRSWSAEECTMAYMRLHSMLRLLDATAHAPWRTVKGRTRFSKYARRTYYILTGLLRRIKHEWMEI